MEADKEWKKSVGFPINYSPDDSEDDFDRSDVVMRHPRQSEILLADGGDGAEADLLGTTPPRERIRDKQKRKAFMDSVIFRESSKRGEDSALSAYDQNLVAGRNTRLSLKLQRSRDRDWKQDQSQRDKTDSLPSPSSGAPMPAVPTLVESCSRFMSLTSRLKCRATPRGEDTPEEAEEPERRCDEEFPPSRVNFHKTFSMLINMGSAEKGGCRRTISHEEQIWQNELKDLIWLELQAKIAGRSLAEQDVFLCAQRNIVPTIVQNIRNYRFVHNNPCPSRSRLLAAIPGSTEDLSQTKVSDDVAGINSCCLSFNCQHCIDAVGKAMKEVGTLLDSFYNANSLYPSSHAMNADHPLVATQLFKNRLKAMCLWYNTALHMRLKMLGIRRMTRTMKLKLRRRGFDHLASIESQCSRQSFTSRPCQVRFIVSTTPSDSNNSDSSGQTEIIKPNETLTSQNVNSDQSAATENSQCENSESKISQSENSERKNSQSENSNNENLGASGKVVVDRKVSCDEGNMTEEEEEDKKVEVDSSTEKKDLATPTTPEIVISDSRYGTADTVASNESGYTSCYEEPTKDADDPYDIGSLEEITVLRLLNKCEVSTYRSYHQEMLKTQGVRKCMQFINKVRRNLLHKVYHTLEKPDKVKPEPFAKEEGDPVEVFEDTKEEDDKTDPHDEEANNYELKRYGCWSEESMAMGLPSFRSHFLLLSTICMEVVHAYLELRLEDRPLNPSCLTVKQIIHELKEGLDIATEMRASFAANIEAALAGQTASEHAKKDLLLVVRTFDNTIQTVLKQYLSYLTTMSEVDELGKHCLQSEWTFTARLAKRVRCAALLAPVAFSEIACNQLQLIQSQFSDKFGKLEEFAKTSGETDKHFIFAICRAVQDIFASERDATLQTAHWARTLASRLARAPPPAYRPQRAAIFESLMRIRDLIVKQTKHILERSRGEYDEISSALTKESMDALSARTRELMLQVYKLGFELHKELYKYAQAPFQLLQEKSSTKGRRRPVSLQPTRRPHERERRKRPETMLIHQSFNPMIHKELHRFVHEAPRAPGSRRSVNTSPPKARAPKFMRSDSVGEDGETNVFDDKLFENINSLGENQTQSSIELLLSGEQPEAAEVELRSAAAEARVCAEECQWATRVARAIVEFAKCWMQFVIERCDKGRGLRPRWACQGLEFLMLACDPCNTKHLTEEEFEDLKKKMDGCISHVIGCRPAAPRADPCNGSPDTAHRRRPRLHSPLPSSSSTLSSRSVPAPPTPPLEPEPLMHFPGIDYEAHSARVNAATKRLDEEREQKLQEMKSVGRVLEATVLSYEPKLRQLKFKWQRGLKIGAGTFGKVYTVVNTETGQLLAMKEISIGYGDRRALQRAANELKVLEGVVHPHLVRYYGCECHREEMLIFMELCVEGSLEALVATTGALEEHMVRRYSKQLVSAVAELHARSIAHRDIKSGNIFLTNEGNCLKLGDFGCAVKIRANTTAAGELMGHVGTQAYMAPEVFMKATGHGRAADVWSLGCVVTEMASGKRPFSEYDSNVQIMFVVGMGGRPAIPDSLSAEGQDFCRACLTHEPDQRPRAEALYMHHFLKVHRPAHQVTQYQYKLSYTTTQYPYKLKSDEECNCEPAYLLT